MNYYTWFSENSLVISSVITRIVQEYTSFIMIKFCNKDWLLDFNSNNYFFDLSHIKQQLINNLDGTVTIDCIINKYCLTFLKYAFDLLSNDITEQEYDLIRNYGYNEYNRLICDNPNLQSIIEEFKNQDYNYRQALKKKKKKMAVNFITIVSNVLCKLQEYKIKRLLKLYKTFYKLNCNCSECNIKFEMISHDIFNHCVEFGGMATIILPRHA